MKKIFLICFIIFLYSCCKEQESFNYTQIDNNGIVIGGDTTQGTLTQDAKLNDWATDSLSSIYLGLNNPKYRGCNHNIKVVMYPNPVSSSGKLYLKIKSSIPILSYALAYPDIKINGGFNGNSKMEIVEDITNFKSSLQKSKYEFYIATNDSCIYHGFYNLARE